MFISRIREEANAEVVIDIRADQQIKSLLGESVLLRVTEAIKEGRSWRADEFGLVERFQETRHSLK